MKTLYVKIALAAAVGFIGGYYFCNYRAKKGQVKPAAGTATAQTSSTASTA